MDPFGTGHVNLALVYHAITAGANTGSRTCSYPIYTDVSLMMDTRKALLLILFQAMVNATVFAVEEDSTSPRSVYFLTRENVRLKGHVVKRFASTSLVSCSHSCLTNGWCTSTNFKMLSRMNGKGTCELNKPRDHQHTYTNTEFKEHQVSRGTRSYFLNAFKGKASKLLTH